MQILSSQLRSREKATFLLLATFQSQGLGIRTRDKKFPKTVKLLFLSFSASQKGFAQVFELSIFRPSKPCINFLLLANFDPNFLITLDLGIRTQFLIIGTGVRIPRPTVVLGIRTFYLFVRISRPLFCPDTESPHLVRIPNPDVIDSPDTETPVYKRI